MKNLKFTTKPAIAAMCLLCAVLSSCEPSTPPKQSIEVIVKKVVKAKNQAEETRYRYKYNLWKGNFYHQPDIHSVYYIVYTDGSYDKVDVGRFTITSIGDTISTKVTKWQ